MSAWLTLLFFRSDLLERILRALTQPEDLSHERQYRMGVAVFMMWLGHGRAHGHPGVMQELVLQPDGHVRNRLAVGLGQVRPARIQGGEFSLANLIGTVSKLLEKQTDVALVPQLQAAGGRFALDDGEGRVDPLLPRSADSPRPVPAARRHGRASPARARRFADRSLAETRCRGSAKAGSAARAERERTAQT